MLYGKPPTADEAAAWGLTLEEATRTVEVWPDNVLAIEVFSALRTQWRVGGMGSATGLDYAALPVVMRLMKVPEEEQIDLFEDVQIMEVEALITMRKAEK